MTLAEWRADGKKTEEWRQVLATPIVAEALSVLREHFLHSNVFTNDLNAHALQGAKRDGYYEFYQNLRALAAYHQPPKGELPQEWRHQKIHKPETPGDTK